MIYDMTARGKLLGILVVLVAPVVFIFIAGYFEPVSLRHYNRLELGLTENQVRAIVGKEPEHCCYFEKVKVCYYLRSLIARSVTRSETVPLDAPHEITATKDVPKIYGAFQIMYSSNGSVIAYGWNGECNEVVTTQGNFPGSDLTKVPPDVMEALVTK